MPELSHGRSRPTVPPICGVSEMCEVRHWLAGYIAVFRAEHAEQFATYLSKTISEDLSGFVVDLFLNSEDTAATSETSVPKSVVSAQSAITWKLMLRVAVPNGRSSCREGTVSIGCGISGSGPQKMVLHILTPWIASAFLALSRCLRGRATPGRARP